MIVSKHLMRTVGLITYLLMLPPLSPWGDDEVMCTHEYSLEPPSLARINTGRKSWAVEVQHLLTALSSSPNLFLSCDEMCNLFWLITVSQVQDNKTSAFKRIKGMEPLNLVFRVQKDPGQAVSSMWICVTCSVKHVFCTGQWNQV